MRVEQNGNCLESSAKYWRPAFSPHRRWREPGRRRPGSVGSASDGLEPFRRRLSRAGGLDQLEADLLALPEIADAGALDGVGMDKNILAAVIRGVAQKLLCQLAQMFDPLVSERIVHRLGKRAGEGAIPSRCPRHRTERPALDGAKLFRHRRPSLWEAQEARRASGSPIAADRLLRPPWPAAASPNLVAVLVAGGHLRLMKWYRRRHRSQWRNRGGKGCLRGKPSVAGRRSRIGSRCLQATASPPRQG